MVRQYRHDYKSLHLARFLGIASFANPVAVIYLSAIFFVTHRVVKRWIVADKKWKLVEQRRDTGNARERRSQKLSQWLLTGKVDSSYHILRKAWVKRPNTLVTLNKLCFQYRRNKPLYT